jgi:hypothetical protein
MQIKVEYSQLYEMAAAFGGADLIYSHASVKLNAPTPTVLI